jgi:hypothetical protein
MDVDPLVLGDLGCERDQPTRLRVVLAALMGPDGVELPCAVRRAADDALWALHEWVQDREARIITDCAPAGYYVVRPVDLWNPSQRGRADAHHHGAADA